MISTLTKNKKALILTFVFLFTALGVQSSHADYYPSGIQQNVSEENLRLNGWTLFYEQTYGTVIGNTTTPIRPIGQYVILSGKAVGSSTIMVAAAAPTAQVFTETVRNIPQLLNGTYWYYTLATNCPTCGSIGFAPTSSINQVSADISDLADPLRMSWHLQDGIGGYRLGTFLDGGNNSVDYLKQVWTWNGPESSRKSSNLTFKESLYDSDKLSDPDGQLRITIDAIDAKYGYLIK